jgi:hypothetical protein
MEQKNRNKKIILRVDSRSKRWQVAQTFGQVLPLDLPEEYQVKDNIVDFVQSVGDVECTAITCADIASDKDSIIYDHDDLFQRIPSNQWGAVPQDALGETIKNGLLPVGQSQRTKPFSSYYEAHTGGRDAFDSVRSALITCKYPIAIFTMWYEEWLGQITLPIGQNTTSGHMYSAEGWKIINNEPMLIIEAWLGHKVYMSREVFNKAVSVWGCGTAVLSTLQMDIDRKKTITEAILDAIKNTLLWIQEQIDLLVKKNEMTPYQPISEVLLPIVNSINNQSISDSQPIVKYDWSTKETSRHSVRVICDEEGLTVSDKNDLCATIGGESNWYSKAIGKPNYDGSKDYGIIQLNSKFWIGEGKLFPTTDYVLNNPEPCVRWMCKQWKLGNKNWWYAYKNGSYRKFLI